MFRYAVDLITFFDPDFWRVAVEPDVRALGQAEPRAFWDRMLDAAGHCGVAGIELTFEPFGYRSLLAAYGGVDGARDRLAAAGLEVASGFFADVAIEGGIGDPAREARWLDTAARYADFLAAVGSDIMVAGLPMRKSWDAMPPSFADLDGAKRAADFANRLGATTLRRGVKLALHTEAHSIFSHPRDVDLLLLLTDPVYVGFCPDSAHILLSGGDPVAVAAKHAERLVTAHWKDAVGPMPVHVPIDRGIHRAHRPFFRALGDGAVDLAGWSALMASRADMAWAILEIDAVSDPATEVRRSLAVAQRLAGPAVATEVAS